ncbi:hypothetical protein MHPYR_530048 [uncultured Mycobacterium sp.]|uniref:Uncharacterized protein n=1 Tax=uncultured Mycobacterium sp. TaxID=171292 RepID=A0A1Y5PQ51_9MYCO|nr:hypothetical protein MHPYR_530048 [uncultured Mycobacterium sp.]
MDLTCYERALYVISLYRDQDAEDRSRALETIRQTETRPLVVIAMIRIAAMLAKNTHVTDGFAEQLWKSPYCELEDGILNITDQVLAALDDDPAQAGYWEDMLRIPELLAAQES